MYHLQTGVTAECKLFQKISERGHYAGRTAPTNTRQGTYAAAPNGEFLASVNTNDPKRMARMLETALAKWKTLPRDKRLPAEKIGDAESVLVRAESRYPKDGLVLRVTARDLPRELAAVAQPDDWRRNAWNQDFAWFTKDEARQFVSEKPVVGAKHNVSDEIVRRVARCHLLDFVRGQTAAFDEAWVEKAALTSEVTSVDGNRITLRLEGLTRAVEEGKWAVAGFKDMDDPSKQTRGLETRLLGRAVYDLKAQRFTAFELVAIGSRWGGTQYNCRTDDLATAPIGFAFTLAGDAPAERIAPAFFWSYGWK